MTSVVDRIGSAGEDEVEPTHDNRLDEIGPLEAERRMWRIPTSEEIRTLAAGTGLLGRFGYLVLTQAIVVSLGVVYWAVTTHFVSAAAVGVSAAAVSTAMFLSAFGILGIGSLLLVELNSANPDDRPTIMAVGVAVAVVSAFFCAAVVWGLSSHLGRSLTLIGRSPVDSGLFVAGTMLTNAASVLDAIAIGLHRSRVQLARNTGASALRLAFVLGAVFLGARSTTMLLVAWVMSLAVSASYSAAAFGLWRSPRRMIRLVFNAHVVRRYRVLALRHHALNLAITSVTYFLPVLAALLLVPADYAYFSIAQLVSSAALVIPAFLAMTLFAEATGSDALLRRHIRRTLPIGFACCALLLVVFLPSAPWVLHIFGHAYSVHGTTTLRLLLLGGIPYVVKDHWVAIRRAQRRLSEAARWVACAMVVEAAAAAVGGALYGLTGLCGFWVAAAFLELPFFTPGVFRVWRSNSGEAEEEPEPTWTIAGRRAPSVGTATDLWWAPSGGVATRGIGAARAARRVSDGTPERPDTEQWWW